MVSMTIVFIGAITVFALMRLVVEPKLSPGRQIWERVLGPEPADAAILAGARLAGTLGLLAGLGALIGLALTAWVESLDVVEMGLAPAQEAADRVSGALALFDAGALLLSWTGVSASIIYVVLFAAGLLYWSARSTRAAEERIREAVDDLRERALANQLPALPPDERIRGVEEAIAAAHMANAGGDVIEALYTRRLHYDLIRRVDANLLREIGDQVPESRIVRMLGILISMPLVHHLKLAGRVLSALAMALVIPASLVIASPELRDALDKKRPVLEALGQALTLELALSGEKPEATQGESPDVAQPNTEPGRANEDEETPCEAAGMDLTAEGCAAATEFAAAFEAAWGAALLDLSGASVSKVAEGIGETRRAWARRAVLTESVVRRSGSVFVAETAPAARPDWARAVMDAVLRARTGDGPVTGFGKPAAEFFGRVFRRFATRGEAVLVERRPLTKRELYATLMMTGVGHMGDFVLSAGETGVLDRIVAEVAKEMLATRMDASATADLTGRERPRRRVEIAAAGAAAAVLDTQKTVGGRLRIDDQAMRAVGMFIDPEMATRHAGVIDWVERLEFPGRRGNAPPPPVALGASLVGDIDWDSAETALRRFTDAEGRPPELGAFSSFSSLFPGIQGQLERTDEARVARLPMYGDKVGVAMYGEPPNNAPSATDGGRGSATGGRSGAMTLRAGGTTPFAKGRLELARSFERLRGHQKVGGVLIGRDPDGVAADLDVVGMEFVIDDRESRLNLEMIHHDGRKTLLGPYDPGLAHLALAYAADGRPVAVTIVSAWPLEESKIMLHPALVDTVVGCHAISLDLFVSKFGLGGLLRTRIAAEIAASRWLVNIYRRAWSERWLGRLEGPGKTLQKEHAQRLRQSLQEQEREQRESGVGDLQGSMPKGFKTAAVFLPLRDRPRLFDPKLVDTLEQCVTESVGEGATEFVDCVSQRARQAGLEWRGGLTPSWERVPTHTTTTGVRERAFKVDREFEFAQPSDDVRDGPLQFVFVNTTPTTQILWRRGNGPTEFVDASQVWELEGTRAQLHNRVVAGVLTEREKLRTLRTMHEFTSVQRLFRVAFDGGLGDRFPVERLAELARETAKRVDFQVAKTPRWLPGNRRNSKLGEEGLNAVRELREALGVPSALRHTCPSGTL